MQACEDYLNAINTASLQDNGLSEAPLYLENMRADGLENACIVRGLLLYAQKIDSNTQPEYCEEFLTTAIDFANLLLDHRAELKQALLRLPQAARRDNYFYLALMRLDIDVRGEMTLDAEHLDGLALTARVTPADKYPLTFYYYLYLLALGDATAVELLTDYLKSISSADFVRNHLSQIQDYFPQRTEFYCLFLEDERELTAACFDPIEDEEYMEPERETLGMYVRQMLSYRQ